MQEGGQETPRAHGRRRRRDAYPPTRWGWRPSINFPLFRIDRAERRAKKKIFELVAHYSLARPGGVAGIRRRGSSGVRFRAGTWVAARLSFGDRDFPFPPGLCSVTFTFAPRAEKISRERRLRRGRQP